MKKKQSEKRQYLKEKFSIDEAAREDVWYSSYATGTVKRKDKKTGKEKDVYISELSQIHRTLAKVANQRMVRLEQAAKADEKMDYILEAGFYYNAQIYLKSKGREETEGGGARFSESPLYGTYKNAKGQREIDTYKLKNEITRLQGLLYKMDESGDIVSAPSSTLKGWKSIEEKRIHTFTEADDPDNPGQKKHGLKKEIVDKKTFYRFLNSKNFDKLVKNFGTSEAVMKLFRDAGDRGMKVTNIVNAINDYMRSLPTINDSGDKVDFSYEEIQKKVVK